MDPLLTLKAMADATRLRILGILAAGEQNVSRLAMQLELREPTVSHHLAKLAEAGLVTMRGEGTQHFYALDAAALRTLGKEVLSPAKVALIAEGITEEAWEKKVLRSFLKGETLTKIPDTRKKRDVILKWLITKFDDGQVYPEKEVNAILKRHHEDVATLRRELVMARLLKRENSIYWKP
jgi:hypothetical protein